MQIRYLMRFVAKKETFSQFNTRARRPGCAVLRKISRIVAVIGGTAHEKTDH